MPRTWALPALATSLAAHGLVAALLLSGTPPRATMDATPRMIEIHLAVEGAGAGPPALEQEASAPAPDLAPAPAAPAPAAPPDSVPVAEDLPDPEPTSKPAVQTAARAPVPPQKPERSRLPAPPASSASSAEARDPAQAATATQANALSQAAAVGSRPAGYSLGSAACPKPPYPRMARMRGQEGRVTLSVRVAADGRVAAVEVAGSSGHPLLDRAAARTVADWRLEPARRAGVAVPAVETISIRFDLTEAG